MRGWVGGGAEESEFLLLEPKFKIAFFSGGEGGGRGGGGLEQVIFFYRESIFLGGVGSGWRTGVGGWTDEQAQAFKCDLGLQPR